MIEKPIIIKNLFSEDLINYLSNVCKIYLRSNQYTFDIRESNTIISANSVSSHEPWSDALLLCSLKKIKEITRKNLEPTYSYVRLYTKYSDLPEHTDRPSCEYSLTLFIDSCGKFNWPIRVQDKEFILDKGDAVLYKGCDWKHSRNEFLGDYHFQCFLHFVDMDGPNASFIYDQRKNLGEHK